jgi:hypothetical protein
MRLAAKHESHVNDILYACARKSLTTQNSTSGGGSAASDEHRAVQPAVCHPNDASAVLPTPVGLLPAAPFTDSLLRSPLLLHIPHASTCIPGEALGDFPVDRDTLDAELLQLTDRFTDALYGDGFPPAQIVTADVSRLVVDVERFADDAAEPCAAHGMGAVYVRTSSGAPPPHRRAFIEEHHPEIPIVEIGDRSQKSRTTVGWSLPLERRTAAGSRVRFGL